ncbi:MAG TPA: lamin tail domain-containing protein, partial [Gemmatimonadaceae bacterium]
MTRFVRSALLATAGLLALTTSCNVERTIVPKQARIAKVGGNGASVVTPSVVISQVYGGGGNSGATFKNDFIELFNPGTSAVNVAGWSVQYVSGTGTGTWAVTALSGTIPAGAYYLVQEAAGAAGTVNLPTPDATGSIGMGAANGKVALVNNTTALAGGCPVGAQIVDFAPYGSPSSCTIVTPTLTNTTAALRGDGGCTYSGSASADFTAAAPTPRNSASPTHSCGGPPPPAVAFVDVFPHSATQPAGATQQFTASATDASHTPIDGVTFTWTSTAEATVDATGLATGVSVGTATITATASGISGTATLTVTPPPPPPAGVGDVVISQAYGGGGNAGATLKNDFIEIFNRSANPVNVNGWSVQHASAAGATWSVTPLSGTIPAGGYYLVQESQGAGGTVNLPTPDAVGTITMGATSGKDLISTSITPFAVACPS